MKKEITAGLGAVLLIAVSCCLMPLKALAITNEERIQKLDDKFIDGEISEETYKRLLQKYGGGAESSQPKAEAKSVQEVAGNLVKNFSFEKLAFDGFPEGWTIPERKPDNKFQRIEVSTSVAHSGKNSMNLSCTPMQYGTDKVAQELTLKPGKKYKVVFWAKGENVQRAPANNGRACVANLDYKTKGGKFKPIYVESHSSNEWKVTTKIVEIPDDASEEGRICLRLFWASGTLWFDDVVVLELP